MESLVRASDPFLALAGALFLIGVAFDTIFSKHFKAQLRKRISELSSGGRPGKYWQRYTDQFVREILSSGRPAAFFIRTLSLSAVFYILVAFFETKLNHGYTTERLQSDFFVLLLKFSPPVLVVFLLNMCFDWISAYISILYFRIIQVCETARQAILVLISDVFMSALVWSVVFAGVLVIHIKLADLEWRQSVIGIGLKPADGASSVRQGFIALNKSLESSTVFDVQMYERSDFRFLAAGSDSRIIILSNVPDMSKLATSILRGAFIERNSEIVRPILSAEGIYYTAVETSNVLGAQELLAAYRNYLQIVSPLRVLFEGGGYLAVRQSYSTLVASAYRLSDWTEDNVAAFCDGQRVAEKAISFDFGNCKEYVVLNTGILQYLRVAAGYAFIPNYWISYRAFFWSSLAMNLTFYIVWLIVIFAREIKRLAALIASDGVFNFEGVFFTPIFCCLSVVCLVLFAGKTVASMIAY